MKSITENITKVVEQKLCNACGACAVVCRLNAITFKETIGGNVFPEIDATKCNNCGLCLEVCPGINFCDILLKKTSPNPFVGKVVKAYIGRAKDEAIFKNSQSGGAVSALLCYALDSKLVNTVVTVAMQWGNPPRASVYLAKSREEVLNVQKSKYSMVPVLSVLRELKERDRRIMLVGLPCHIHGLWNLYELIPELKEKIVLTVGLFCERTLTNAAIDYFIDNCNFKSDQEKTLIFKDKQQGGYPGNVYVKAERGKGKVIPSQARMRIKDFFTPARCRICFDKLNIFSDISVGDPWGIVEADHKNGETVCVARTDEGLDLMQKVEAYAEFRELAYDKIYTGQKIKNKQKEWHSFKEVWNQQNLDLPNYCQYIKTKPEKIKLRKYKNKLKFSLNLDDFDSRKKLLDYVDKRVSIKNISRILLSLLIITLKILRKIYRGVKNVY